MPQSIGIIGGKEKMGLYFAGVQDDKLLILDPHLSQSTVDKDQILNQRESFRCKVMKTLKIS